MCEALGVRVLHCMALALLAVGCERAAGEPARVTPAGTNVQAAKASASAAPPAAVEPPKPPETNEERARRVAQEFIILDGHIDVPYRLQESRDPSGKLTENILERTPKGDFDLPRAKLGGLDAPFFSVYVPARLEKNGAKRFADETLDMIEGIVQSSAGSLVIAKSPEEVRQAKRAGKIAVLLGLENGAPIEGKLEHVSQLFERNIRYITLAHSRDNHLSDSSYDMRRTHRGLSAFGKKVVAKMNTLGMLVDVSHLSDEAFFDVIETSRAPVIASHSSCRHFTPGFTRNMSDEMILALSRNGGVIQINFGSDFLDGDLRARNQKRKQELTKLLADRRVNPKSAAAEPIRAEFWARYDDRFSTVEKVADHIDHVVKLVGVDYVGLGSDFDGVGDTLPTGLKDVSYYPNLIRVLLERGYSEPDIEKICSGNILRLWERADRIAAGG